MPPYRLAIFDFDGTLADSFPWLSGMFDAMAVRHRFRRSTPQQIEAMRGMHPREIIAELGVSRWRLPLIAWELRRHMARETAPIPLFHGALEALDALRSAGVALAIVSSNAEVNVRRLLGPVHAARVDHYGCSAGVFGKPRKFRAVLARAGVAPREAIAIGDEVRDVEAARAVGLATAAVTWGYAAEAALRAAAPTAVFTSLDELTRALTGRADR